MSPHPKYLLSLVFFVPQVAHAIDAFSGLTVSMTYPKNTITHYSATPRGGDSCHLEHGVGGADSSPSGFRPLSYRIDKPGMMHGRPTILAAVPAHGGNSGIFGCFFGLPDAYPGKLFYAGDRYGPDSDGKVKTDISSPCTSIVNKTMKSKLVVYNCPGKKGGFAPPLKREPAEQTPAPIAKKKQPEPKVLEQAKAEEAPKAEVKPPETAPAEAPPPEAPKAADGGSCNWYAIYLCNHTLDESNKDRDRLSSSLEVINTSDFSNFSGGWYCVASPAATQAEAAAKVRQFKSRAPAGYVKKGC